MRKYVFFQRLVTVFFVGMSVLFFVSCVKEKKTLVFKYEPSEPKAFAYLPRDKYGVINWVEAMDEGIIKPKDSLDARQKTSEPLDLDVYFESKGGMPGVMYPHKPHTIWLDCTNCHPSIFKMQRGSNPITMLKIVAGEYCGRCHGKVAFPLSNCLRCHSQPAKGPNRVNVQTIPESLEKIKTIVQGKENEWEREIKGTGRDSTVGEKSLNMESLPESLDLLKSIITDKEDVERKEGEGEPDVKK